MAYTDIDDPTAYFQTKLYTGGTAEAKTFDGNSNLKPDWFWSKKRGAVQSHQTADSVRGIANSLRTDTTGAEYTNSETDDLASFDTNGFTFSGTGDTYNGTYQSSSYVAWCWKAGDSNTSVSSSGSGNNAINACTYRANTTAGFSIIKYTGLNSEISDGQKTKVTHGLGAKPDFLIIKNIDLSSNWIVTRGIDNDYHGVLNSSNAFSGSLFTGNQNQSDSTHFVVGNEGAVNANGDEFIAYVFAEKKGFSKFGSYTGNGSTDGTFIYTGFKPAFVIFKRSSGVQDWGLFDNKRSNYNPVDELIYPNYSNAESGDNANKFDFVSNGFKLRASGQQMNQSGDSYIYMAFAENPFVTSTGIPTTAR